MGKSTKVQTPKKQAERAAKDASEHFGRVTAGIGLPDAQRCPERMEIVDAEMGSRQRSNTETARRLTKAERLHRTNTISKDQLAAINLYVSAAEGAYGSCVQATAYGDGGGSSPTASAVASHARQLTRVGRADRYRRARAALLPHHVGPFERIVIGGDGLIEVVLEMARERAEELGRTMAWEAGRELLRTCCDRLCVEFAGELRIADVPRVHLAATMLRMDEHARAAATIAVRPISDAIAVQMLDLDRGVPESLQVAPLVLSELVRENGLDAEPDVWGGVPLVVRETWNWGWIVGRVAVWSGADLG